MKDLENRVTHILSEWLNGNALLGEERYRNPAKAVIAECKREELEMLSAIKDRLKCSQQNAMQLCRILPQVSHEQALAMEIHGECGCSITKIEEYLK